VAASRCAQMLGNGKALEAVHVNCSTSPVLSIACHSCHLAVSCAGSGPVGAAAARALLLLQPHRGGRPVPHQLPPPGAAQHGHAQRYGGTPISLTICVRFLAPLHRFTASAPLPSTASSVIEASAENNDMESSLREEVLLDENAQAQKHSFYMVRGFEVRAPSNRNSIDTSGCPGCMQMLYLQKLSFGGRHQQLWNAVANRNYFQADLVM
jgi:hypothetical protein